MNPGVATSLAFDPWTGSSRLPLFATLQDPNVTDDKGETPLFKAKVKRSGAVLIWLYKPFDDDVLWFNDDSNGSSWDTSGIQAGYQWYN